MTDEQQPGPAQPAAPDEVPTQQASDETTIQPAPAPSTVPTAPSAPSGPFRPAGRRKREFKGKYVPRRRVCAFCADKSARIDYKEAGRLRRFVSDRGKIEPRRKTGTCAKHQRVLSTALKRARFLALLPYTAEHARVMGGPPLGRG